MARAARRPARRDQGGVRGLSVARAHPQRGRRSARATHAAGAGGRRARSGSRCALATELGRRARRPAARPKPTSRVAAILTREPDRARILQHRAAPDDAGADVAATGLIQTGSRVTYRLLAAGERRGRFDASDALRPTLTRGQRIETLAIAQARVPRLARARAALPRPSPRSSPRSWPPWRSRSPRGASSQRQVDSAGDDALPGRHAGPTFSRIHAWPIRGAGARRVRAGRPHRVCGAGGAVALARGFLHGHAPAARAAAGLARRRDRLRASCWASRCRRCSRLRNVSTLRVLRRDMAAAAAAPSIAAFALGARRALRAHHLAGRRPQARRCTWSAVSPRRCSCSSPSRGSR